MYPCHHEHGTQEFLYSKDTREIRIASLNYEDCLGVSESGKAVTTLRCVSKEGKKKETQWIYHNDTLLLESGGMCLSASNEASKKSPFSLRVLPCDASSTTQRWVWNSNDRKKKKIQK